MVVLGINTADDRQIALNYLKANNVTFLNVLDTSEAANRTMFKLETLAGYSAVPLNYVIDREGKVVDAWYDQDKRRGQLALKKTGL